MPAQTLIVISQEALLTLPREALIALYNAESKRLAGTDLEPHLVDETCRPRFIVGLFASLARRYQMMRDEASNERVAMQPLIESPARPQSEAEKRREMALLTKGNQGFQLLK